MYLNHTGLVAIENTNTMTKLIKNLQKQTFQLSFVARLATNYNRKQFLAIFDHHSSIVKSVLD